MAIIKARPFDFDLELALVGDAVAAKGADEDALKRW